MNELTVKFVKEKDTKNTVRFTEVEEGGYSRVGTVYIPKATLAMAGIDPNNGFTMTLKPLPARVVES